MTFIPFLYYSLTTLSLWQRLCYHLLSQKILKTSDFSEKLKLFQVGWKLSSNSVEEKCTNSLCNQVSYGISSTLLKVFHCKLSYEATIGIDHAVCVLTVNKSSSRMTVEVCRVPGKALRIFINIVVVL